MRGHEPLIAMRMRRRKPSTFVAMDIHPGRHWLAEHWHEWEGLGPQIVVDPSEAIGLLDLRFLVCLDVCISGDVGHADQVRRLRESCAAAGAARVFGGLHRARNDLGELETVELFDSEGVLTWPA